MTIPKPANQKPLKFGNDNWVSSGTFHDRFFKSPLEHTKLLKIFFQHVDAKASLGVLVPWTWLLRPPHIETNEDNHEDQGWRPVRILGSGSFGVVTLWQREEASKILDEVAIKQTSRPALQRFIDEAGTEDSPRFGLPKEAAINADLNSQEDSESIGFLRNFKYYPGAQFDGNNRDPGTYRFYFNFCPFVTLDTLAKRYRLWDEWLPEAFIWHLLVQLVQGVQTMEKPPPGHSLIGVEGDFRNYFMLHLDLKPQNILLDYPAEQEADEDTQHPKARRFDFPSVRTSDFGTSAYTSTTDKRNPWNLNSGTAGYKPPEQTYLHDKWGNNFQQPPIDPDDKWTEAHNIWCIGKCIFDTMTHEMRDTLDRVKLNTDNAAYVSRDSHFLKPFWGDKDFWQEWSSQHFIRDVLLHQEEVSSQNQQEQYRAMVANWNYSDDLRTLIWDMLDPNPARRLRSSEILARVPHYLQDIFGLSAQSPGRKLTKRQQMASSEETAQHSQKLSFRHTEINQMQAGKGNYQADEDEYQKLLKQCDPDWAPLKPPQRKWKPFVRQLDPKAPQVHVFEHAGNIAAEDVYVQLTSASGSMLQGVSSEHGSVDRHPVSSRPPPTAADYQALEHTQLADQEVRRIKMPKPTTKRIRLRDEYTKTQLIGWLMDLDQGGVPGAHPEVLSKPTSRREDPSRSKRGSKGAEDDGGLSSRPSKRQDKGKGKAKGPAFEHSEQEDMQPKEPPARTSHSVTSKPPDKSAKSSEEANADSQQEETDQIDAPMEEAAVEEDKDVNESDQAAGKGRAARAPARKTREAQVPQPVAESTHGVNAGVNAPPRDRTVPDERPTRALRDRTRKPVVYNISELQRRAELGPVDEEGAAPAQTKKRKLNAAKTHRKEGGATTRPAAKKRGRKGK